MAVSSSCANPKECSASTDITESPSFGWGDLDDNGFWEHPCDACRQQWKLEHPEDFSGG